MKLADLAIARQLAAARAANLALLARLDKSAEPLRLCLAGEDGGRDTGIVLTPAYATRIRAEITSEARDRVAGIEQQLKEMGVEI